MNREYRKLAKFSQTLPPIFGSFAKAYLKHLSTLTGEEIEMRFGGEALEKIKKVFPEKFMPNEDFRAKNIGQPVQMQRRDYSAMLEESKRRNEQFEAERAARLKGRVYRPLRGVKISIDYARTWKVVSLCDECIRLVEEPARKIDTGVSATQRCDWCEALNEMFQGEK